PVVEEEIEVGKRAVSGGAVRVVSRVVSRPVSESVELRREEAVVERRRVDREASPDDAQAFQERTIEVQELAEQPVVQKTAHVVEEVVVGKRVSTDTQQVEDTVRRTEVNVERVGDADRGDAPRDRGAREVERGGVTGAVAGGRRAFADVEDEFRNDYQANHAQSGASYEELRPAYQGGYELREDDRFADRGWDDVEPEARDRWEREHPGSAWERVKAAVRRGWDRATTGSETT
ncbi:MAG: YsnF/AvaK domain-containing protein, partial [Rhizobacter sp.]|nr:YsnF/AvaK domain-containing protein [Rhizobacter sp.]